MITGFLVIGVVVCVKAFLQVGGEPDVDFIEIWSRARKPST